MADKEQALRILKSWHLIEFFQTYNLEKQEESVCITLDELVRCGNALLPWLDTGAMRQLNIPAGNVRYILHLGVFAKSEVERLSEHMFGKESDPVKIHEQEQRLDNEGLTCFAKLALDAYGTPSLAEMSVSTLPWALGHLQKSTAHTLSLENYRRHSEKLAEQLSRFGTHLPFHPQKAVHTLSAEALLALLNTLFDWADYRPDSQFVVQLDWQMLPDTNKKALAAPGGDGDAALPATPEDTGLPAESAAAEDDGDPDEAQSSAERVLPILNSFYLDDIERAMAAISIGGGGKALLDYLRIRLDKYPDLYTQPGLRLIIDKVSPLLTPQGRWPANSAHGMSLMQQFAINTAVEGLRDGGLLSVNGPPGTGKTTMLRDLIAHNLVERAKILAGFNQGEDGLDALGFPVKELAGFEMVVASSNNAAVENISKELPQRKSLGDEFAGLDYFHPVANQVNARKKSGRYQAMEPEEQCWGMIAATLGKKKNRTEFVSRFFFDHHFKERSKEEAERPPAFNFLNFWRWRSLARHRSFYEARAHFNESLQAVESQQRELEECARLTAYFAEHTEESLYARYRLALSESQKRYQLSGDEKEAVDRRLRIVNDSVTIAEAEQKSHEAGRPGFFSRLLRRTEFIEYRHSADELRARVISLLKERVPLLEAQAAAQQRHDAAGAMRQTAEAMLTEAKADYQQKRRRLAELQSLYPDLPIIDPQCPISDPELQRHAFWQNSQINQRRSALFAAAIELHKAWLHETLRKSEAFRNNIFELKTFLRAPGYSDHALSLWRVLFMIVPVVSTTFASLGRMFSTVKGEELGWLLIDEAGQAPPQSAVGGIWRAKRVLVVGDPLQIEPVFVTPPRLVKHLGQSVLGDDAPTWSPANWSVQQLADRANPYGCLLKVMNQPVWIGIPLWVHRRCIEPMFSLANRIAYDNRMIHGSDKASIQSRPLAGGMHNHWRRSTGSCCHRQHKRELEKDTLALVEALADGGCNLSSIYIITPFKAVRSGIADAFTFSPAVARLRQKSGMTYEGFTHWRVKNIGTVHTFQGKENDIVILALGCDPDNQGGAIWAASKPNLLNVALTRAKKHIFVVGDPLVWNDRDFFRDVAQVLPLQ